MSICGNPGCGKPGVSKCSSCSLVSYCGADCQKAHWKAHRPACKQHVGSTSPLPVVSAASSDSPTKPEEKEETKSHSGDSSPVRISIPPEQVARLGQTKEALQKAFGSGKFAEGIKIAEDALEFVKTLPPPVAVSESAQLHLNMSTAFLQMKQFAEAEKSCDSCIKLAEIILQQKPDHPHATELLLMGNGSKSFVYLNSGKLEPAVECALKALSLAESLYPKNDPRLFKPLRGVGLVREREGKTTEAEKHYFRAYSVLSLAGHAASRDAQIGLDDLVNMLMRKGLPEDVEKAEKYALNTFKTIGEKQDSKDEMVLADAAARLAAIRIKLGKFAAAEELMQSCLATRAKYLKPGDPGLGMTLVQLAGTQEPQGKLGLEVEANLVRALEIFSASLGPESQEAVRTMHSLRMLRAKRTEAQGSIDDSTDGDSGQEVQSSSSKSVTKTAASVLNAGVRNASVVASQQQPQPIANVPYDPEEEIAKLRLAPDDVDGRRAAAHRFFNQARYNCSEVLLEEAIQILIRKVGADHPQTNEARQNLGLVRNNHINKLWTEVVDEEVAKANAGAAGKDASVVDGSAGSGSAAGLSSSSSSTATQSSTNQTSNNLSEYERLMSKSNAKLPFATDAPETSSTCVIC